MPAITFYRQAREDGGIRTGIAINQDTVLGLFESAGDESNPALAWFIDLRCEGNALPSDPEDSRDWLLQNGPFIRSAFRRLSRELRAGIDIDSWPFRWEIPATPKGVNMAIVCSCVQRFTALDIAKEIAKFSKSWDRWISKLSPTTEPVS